MSLRREQQPSDSLIRSDAALPTLPPEVLAELEQIAFRVSGTEARAARIEQVISRAETLRAEIASWLACFVGIEPTVPR